MRGDLSKLFAFLGSKPSNQKKRQRSSSIACPREISRSHRTSLPVGLKELPRDSQQMLFPNKTIPKRRKPQLLKGGRSLSLPGVVTVPEDKRCTLATPSNRPGHPQRKRLAENVDIHHCFAEEDFEIEEAQEIWRLLKDRSIYSETSVQGGLLTTTLCSTELWIFHWFDHWMSVWFMAVSDDKILENRRWNEQSVPAGWPETETAKLCCPPGAFLVFSNARYYTFINCSLKRFPNYVTSQSTVIVIQNNSRRAFSKQSHYQISTAVFRVVSQISFLSMFYSIGL